MPDRLCWHSPFIACRGCSCRHSVLSCVSGGGGLTVRTCWFGTVSTPCRPRSLLESANDRPGTDPAAGIDAAAGLSEPAIDDAGLSDGSRRNALLGAGVLGSERGMARRLGR